MSKIVLNGGQDRFDRKALFARVMELLAKIPEGVLSLRMMEEKTILLALILTECNLSRAARYLQISKHALLYKLNEYLLNEL